MKFKSSNQTLIRGISVVQNAVGSPISNPIVENILLSCDKESNKIVFIATNLSLTIRCEGDAEVEKSGEIVLPSTIIINLVNDLPEGDVFIEKEEEEIHIECEEFKGKMKGQSGELFPPFIYLEEGEEISIEAEELKDIIRKTLFATSSEKARYELDGVKIEIKKNELKTVSTDGRRLSIYKTKRENLPDKEIDALIPSKTLYEVQRSLYDEGIVQFKFMERKVQIQFGDTTIISNLLSDNYPQYEKIVPPDSDIKVVMNRDEFSSAIKRVSWLTNLDTNMVIVRIRKGEIEILSEREEIGGEGREKIDAEYDGEEIEIRYNNRFLLDYLRVMDDEKIEMEIRDSRKPGVFRIVGKEEYKYVLMPMRPPEEGE